MDRRGHFQSVGDITTQQMFGLKGTATGDANNNHVPLKVLASTQDVASSSSEASDADADLWNQQDPDDAVLDLWATQGFSAELCASSSAET